MRKLETSVRDNWYSDLYPTWCDYVAVRVSNWEFIHFGYLLTNIFHFYSVVKFFRVFEVFFYRRAQLNYWSN